MKPGVGSMINGTVISVPAKQVYTPFVSVPKTHYLPPQAGSTNGAWQSSGLFLDYEVPDGIGVMNMTTLRFEVNNTTVDAVEPPPTPYWVQQIEIYIGSTLLETLYPNDIRNETVGFLTTDGLLVQNDQLYLGSPETGYPTRGAYGPLSEGRNLKIGASVAYLPFNNCLTTAGLYADGVKEKIKFRVYFPPGLFPSTVVLSSATLVIDEDVGSNADDKKYDVASNTGLVYSTIIRQRQNSAITKIGENDYTLELTGINGSSAGYVVYAGPVVQPGGTVLYTYPDSWYVDREDPSGDPIPNGTPQQVPANSLLTTRYKIDTLELDNKMGNKRTEQLRGEALLSFTWYDHVKTLFGKTSNTYLIPFCTNFKDAVENGLYQGQLWSDGTDRLIIRGKPHNSTLSQDVWNFTVTNYTYQALVFQNGKLSRVIKDLKQMDR